LDLLARDIGNPSSLDPYFTTARHKDWFAGHSWASGIANGAGARDEESSGEALNGYFGLYVYALATSNPSLLGFAKLLLATEVQSVQTYWHLYPNKTHDTPYPELGFREITTVGNVMDQSSGAWLWWGTQRSEIASIQLLPITAVSEWSVDADWVTNMYPWAATEIPNANVGDSWKGYVYMARAVIDPWSAFKQAKGLNGFDNGNSNSNVLYWISTRPKGGKADPICT